MLTTLLQWDTAAARACASLAGWTPLDVAMSALTISGAQGFLWFAIGLALAMGGGPRVREGFVRLAWSLLLALALTSGAIKPIVARARPDMTGIARSAASAFVASHTGGYSFPSGHAALAVAGACALSLMGPRRRALFWALAVLMAFSRLYLGVHHPIDVAAGALLGWAVARLATAGTPCYIPNSASAAPTVPR